MSTAPPFHWIAATRLLGRPVPTGEIYPHICRLTLPSGATVWRSDCAACLHDAQATRGHVPAPLSDEAAALAAAVDQRRTGERE